MPTVKVYNTGREELGDIELDESVFGVEPKEHLFYAVVRYQLAMRRSGNHSTKGRAQVSGGGRKPWRQKGTGRARQGSTRSPHWRGGGVVHGPKPRDYSFKLNRQVRTAALKGALTRRLQEGAIVVLDDFAFSEPRTRQVVDFLGRFGLSEALVVVSTPATSGELAARNHPDVLVQRVEGLNVYDVLNHRHLVLTRDALVALQARLGRSA